MTDKIDLSKAKPGMIACLKPGGKVAIKTIEPNGDYFTVGFENGVHANYQKDGKHNWYPADLIDIIALEEPPFDWKDVKWGDAFITDIPYTYSDAYLGVWFYVGKYLAKEDSVCCQKKDGELTWFYTSNLVRAREHDLKTEEKV